MRPPQSVTPALQELLDNVDAERDEFLGLGEFDDEVRERLRRAFLPDFISDTLNIEGIQANPRVTLAVLDGMALAESDKYVEAEVRNVIDAHGLLERGVAEGRTVSKDLICGLNYEIEKDLLPGAGELRKHDVQISGAQVVPPPHATLDARVTELCLTLEQCADCHPIVRAAWVHRELAEIHPFEDGNGRTARLLQDFVLASAGYLPVGIPAFRRQEYYDALQQADFNDLEPLVSMIANSELTALTKARRVVRDPGVRKAAIARVLKGRETATHRTRAREHEIWRRRVEELIAEARAWAEDLSEGADGARLMRVKVWDPLPYDSWLEIRERGYARNSWVATLSFSEPKVRGFSLLLAAKRLDKINQLRSAAAGPAAERVGLQVLTANVGEKWDFSAPGDPYMTFVGIGVSDAGFDSYIESEGEVRSSRMTATEILEQLFTQAAVKAGWST